eukprot:scaffold204150_cov34-Tisochrysis_lutea.AAC.4
MKAASTVNLERIACAFCASPTAYAGCNRAPGLQMTACSLEPTNSSAPFWANGKHSEHRGTAGAALPLRSVPPISAWRDAQHGRPSGRHQVVHGSRLDDVSHRVRAAIDHEVSLGDETRAVARPSGRDGPTLDGPRPRRAVHIEAREAVRVVALLVHAAKDVKFGGRQERQGVATACARSLALKNGAGPLNERSPCTWRVHGEL